MEETKSKDRFKKTPQCSAFVCEAELKDRRRKARKERRRRRRRKQEEEEGEEEAAQTVTQLMSLPETGAAGPTTR